MRRSIVGAHKRVECVIFVHYDKTTLKVFFPNDVYTVSGKVHRLGEHLLLSLPCSRSTNAILDAVRVKNQCSNAARFLYARKVASTLGSLVREENDIL